MTSRLSRIIPGLALILATLLCSCTKFHDEDLRILDPASFNIPYGEDMVWKEKLKDVPLTLSPFTFTHWSDGKAWTGFVPSRSTDVKNSSDWTDRQWVCITGAGLGAPGMPYFVVGCDMNEPLDAIPARPAAMVRMTYSGEIFSPRMLWINNTAQGFYFMKTGLPGIPPFSSSDWAKVIVNGVRDGVKTGSATIWLARDGSILGDPGQPLNSLSNGGGWHAIDVLDELGEVDYIYFQMQSSRSDMIPTFVLGSFTYTE